MTCFRMKRFVYFEFSSTFSSNPWREQNALILCKSTLKTKSTISSALLSLRHFWISDIYLLLFQTCNELKPLALQIKKVSSRVKLIFLCHNHALGVTISSFIAPLSKVNWGCEGKAAELETEKDGRKLQHFPRQRNKEESLLRVWRPWMLGDSDNGEKDKLEKSNWDLHGGGIIGLHVVLSDFTFI